MDHATEKDLSTGMYTARKYISILCCVMFNAFLVAILFPVFVWFLGKNVLTPQKRYPWQSVWTPWEKFRHDVEGSMFYLKVSAFGLCIFVICVLFSPFVVVAWAAESLLNKFTCRILGTTVLSPLLMWRRSVSRRLLN